MKRSPLRLLLAGFGRVGRSLAGLLGGGASYPGLADLDVEVIGITSGRHGALVDPAGIDLAAAVSSLERQGRFAEPLPVRHDLDTITAATLLDYDVLVELSPLDVTGRGRAAIAHVRAALERGRHVITCNKGPIAWAHTELSRLARERGCALLFEGTVMDGAPVFNLARHGLRGNRVLRLEGVLNSTTNVVLAAMERGGSLEAAVAEAQRLGVAEADPAADLDGWDAAVKLAVLATVLMGTDLAPENVARESVRGIDRERVAAAVENGRRVKMLCEAWREHGGVRARVAARDVPLAEPFAAVEGTGSALRIVTDIMGTLVVSEEAPDLRTTAYAVVSDLFALRGRND